MINANGKRLINLSQEPACVVGNTLFKHKGIHKFSCDDPVWHYKSVIDLPTNKEGTSKNGTERH